MDATDRRSSGQHSSHRSAAAAGGDGREMMVGGAGGGRMRAGMELRYGLKEQQVQVLASNAAPRRVDGRASLRLDLQDAFWQRFVRSAVA